MQTLQDITSTLRRHKSRLYADYPIKSMAIFGSYLQNREKKSSDVDILVEFNDQIGIRFIDLADELETLVGTKIDLVSRNGIKQKYYRAISRDLIYV